MIDQKALTIRLNRVILIEGFQKLSMSKLAAAVNVSRASLYNNFKDKDEIVQAVVARHLKFIAEHPVPQRFAVSSFLPVWLYSLLLMGSTTTAFTVDLQRAYPDLYQDFTVAYRQYFERLEAYVAQGQQAQVILDVFSADFVIFQAQSLVTTILDQVRHGQLPLDRAETYLAATLHFQLAGLLTTQAQGQFDVQQVAGFEATVLREFRETYALIA